MSDGADVAAALGRIPSGLFVLTAGSGAAASGALVSWVQQAGFAPPAVVVAVRKDRAIVGQVRAGAAFCLSVLGQGDRRLMAHFARGEPSFTGIQLEDSAVGVPRLAEVATWLGCRLLGEVGDWSDHVLFCGEVVDGRGDSSADPLVHLRRNGLSY